VHPRHGRGEGAGRPRGILDGGRLPRLDHGGLERRRYGAATLEEAFMAATGRVLEDGADDDEEAA
jgi:hypothetical protein